MGKKGKETEQNGGYEWEYAKKVDNRSTCAKVMTTIYDPSTNEIFGRTPLSWGGIFLFLAIFYACLAGLFAICMKLLLLSIDTNVPRWILDESLIGTSPGLGIRPKSNHAEGASLIRYTANNATNVDVWVKSIDDYLKEYRNASKNRVDCDKTGRHPHHGNVCDFDLTKLGDCNAQLKYGYPQGMPCVFIKLNKIYGWEPKAYTVDDDYPELMPENIKEDIQKASGKTAENTVWISCGGESPADKQNIGKVVYHPTNGFPGHYYPYEKKADYLSPIVAVQFMNPSRRVLINVECRAWAKNIVYKKSSQIREGSVHFELLVD